MSSNHLILCRRLLLPPSIFPSIRVFSNESVLRSRWPKYWSFSFSISPSSEYSELISFKDGLVGSPCSPRDSQESSPTPQFKSIHSPMLRFLYSPTLISIRDYWKNHGLPATGQLLGTLGAPEALLLSLFISPPVTGLHWRQELPSLHRP